MKNFKGYLGMCLFLIALVGAVALAIYSTALRFANPDMTEIRFMLEHKELFIYATGIVLSYIIGLRLLK